MDLTICSPHDYYKKSFQDFMRHETNMEANKWIYDLIHKEFIVNYETIYIDKPNWLLCQDCKFGPQERFLVVFKDTTLHSLRDLRRHHIPLLCAIQTDVRNWLKMRYPNDKLAPKSFDIYFHYMPSIFQLHMHVNQISKSSHNVLKKNANMRKQPLSIVVKNIASQSDFYAKCLVLTKFCKTIKRAETHKKIVLPI